MMNYRRWFLSFLISCVAMLKGFAQADSCSAQISLLTCGPGEDLYSIFGHTAIRVLDRRAGTDIVYNYGTFDDSDPYFYIKFTRGIMLYSLSVESFTDFMAEYTDEHRWVIQQILRLDCADKQKLLAALQSNASEINRYYNYDFYKDNCTLRARNIIRDNSSIPIVFKNSLPTPHPSFRQMIDSYLRGSGKYWEKFGIDILLGSHLDAKASNEEAMFLPDYLMRGFDSADRDNRPLVSSKQDLLNASGQNGNKSSWFTPLYFFVSLALLILLLSLLSSNWSTAIVRSFDLVFFLFLGLLGILMVCLWLGRVDEVCRNNLNLLWALPSHAVIAFLINRRKSWIKYYFLYTALISFILLLGWKWWPQELNHAVIPICLLVIFRSLCIVLRKR